MALIQRTLIKSRYLSSTAGVQKGPGSRPPNRLTQQLQHMKQVCPEAIRAYARCVKEANDAGHLGQGTCQAEFEAVKECYRQVRRTITPP